MARKDIDVVIPMEDRLPFERLEVETAKQFRAFCTFRDMGPDRTIVGAFRIHMGKENQPQASAFFKEWAERFKWRLRAQAYDDHFERLALRKKEAAIEEAAQRHVLEVRNFSTVLNKFEKILMKKLAENPDLRGVRLTDLVNAATRAASIIPKLQEAEMLALGKPQRVEVTGKNGGPISHAVRYVPPSIAEPKPEELEAGREEVEDGVQ